MMALARASAGLLLWSAGFAALYAVHGLGCAAGWHLRPFLAWTLFGWVLTLVWSTTLALGAGLLLWSWRKPAGPPFERRLTRASALAGLAALAATGLPLLFISACT